MRCSISSTLAVAWMFSLVVGSALAEDGKTTKIELAHAKLALEAPKEWRAVKPKSRIVQQEFSAPADAKEGDPRVRITVTAASGSIEANIDRWYTQFSQPDGKSTKDQSKVEKMEVAGHTVHLVDIPGTYHERSFGGPFSGGKTVDRPEYRMLGAIIVPKSPPLVFLKMTGPADLCEKYRDGFQKMLKEMKAED